MGSSGFSPWRPSVLKTGGRFLFAYTARTGAVVAVISFGALTTMRPGQQHPFLAPQRAQRIAFEISPIHD
jgi:hypothetical protein